MNCAERGGLWGKSPMFLWQAKSTGKPKVLSSWIVLRIMIKSPTFAKMDIVNFELNSWPSLLKIQTYQSKQKLSCCATFYRQAYSVPTWMPRRCQCSVNTLFSFAKNEYLLLMEMYLWNANPPGWHRAGCTVVSFQGPVFFSCMLCPWPQPVACCLSPYQNRRLIASPFAPTQYCARWLSKMKTGRFQILCFTVIRTTPFHVLPTNASHSFPPSSCGLIFTLTRPPHGLLLPGLSFVPS